MTTGTSPRGLKYAVRRSGRAVAYCALSIGCGTRDEAGYPAGIAHFVEHNLFRGTSRKSAAVINGYLDRLGGELNAYTTKEEIVLHATVLKEDWKKAAGLLFELATEATFPESEIETERGVVLDEIISYKDNPAEDVYDRFETLLFEGSPLSTPILGTAASVKKITPQMLRKFVAEKFVPSRMVLSVVADIDEAMLEKDLLKMVSGIQAFSLAEKRADAREKACIPSTNVRPTEEACSADASAIKLADGEQASFGGRCFQKVVDKRHHEVNAVIGCRAPSLYQMPERLECAMLANILGGPASNSLLNKELREKRGWVYGIECSYTQYADTGILAITFGCDRPNLDACQKAIDKILSRLREVPLTDRQFKAYRKQLLGQLAISADAGEAQCLSMGKSMLSWGSIMSPEETRKAIS
ncbi:MAG: insulinase family protein, partial [Bacteroidales bacterium]|nr:insulinase family protein [Bacteroidales bacterium]